MEINKAKFERVVKEAKTKAAGNTRWIAAIEKAADGLLNVGWIVTELAHGILVTTESGTYHANSACQCKAYKNGQPCKHRALARLIDLYNETADVAVSRTKLIADIKSTWSAQYPTGNLADELMRRFRRNKLEMLSLDFLQAIHAAP